MHTHRMPYNNHQFTSPGGRAHPHPYTHIAYVLYLLISHDICCIIFGRISETHFQNKSDWENFLPRIKSDRGEWDARNYRVNVHSVVTFESIQSHCNGNSTHSLQRLNDKHFGHFSFPLQWIEKSLIRYRFLFVWVRFYRCIELKKSHPHLMWLCLCLCILSYSCSPHETLYYHFDESTMNSALAWPNHLCLYAFGV